MNIDTLKKRPQPKQKTDFEFFIDNPVQQKTMEIIDKRGSQVINRDEILRRVKKNVTRKDEVETDAIDKPIIANKEDISDSSEFIDETESEKPSKDIEVVQETEAEKEVDKQSDMDAEKESEMEKEVIAEPEEPVEKMQKKRGRKPKEGVFDDSVIEAGLEEMKKKLPKELGDQIIIRAPTYYMNNRKIFTKKINEAFNDYLKKIKSSEKTSKDPEQRTLFTHQEIVRDYLNIYTPYRGLLLFHGLGSGKTCSSIAIAEGMKTNKPVFLLTPASLKMNYFTELKKCGDDLYKKNQYWEFVSITGNLERVEILSKTLSLSREYIRKKKGAWMVDVSKKPNFSTLSSDEQKRVDEQLNEMIRVKYRDENYNGIDLKRLKKLSGDFSRNPFDNHVVIIDEAHNLVSRIVNKLKDKKSVSYRLYEYLMTAQNAKIVLLTGTPVINYPNEIAVLYNLLRGYIKSWTFKLNVKTNDKTTTERFLELFDKEGFNTFDYIEYSGNKLQITRNPFGFINTNKKGVLKGKKRGGMYGGADEDTVKKGESEIDEEMINTEEPVTEEKKEVEDGDETKKSDEVEDSDETEEKEDNDADETEETEDKEEGDEAEDKEEGDEAEDTGVDNYTSQDLMDAQQKIASAQYERISTLQKQVENMEDEMANLKEKNGILEKQLVDGVLEEGKQQELEKDKERLESLEEKLNALSDNIENIKGEVKEPSDEKEDDENEEKMKKELESQKEMFEKQMKTQEEQFEKLNETVNELQKQNEDLQGQINDNDSNKSTNYDMPKIIDKQYQMSSTQDELLEKQKSIIEKQEKDIGDLQGKIEDLSGKIDKLNDNDDVAKQQNALMKEQEKELKREIDQMQKDKDKSSNELEILKAKKGKKGKKDKDVSEDEEEEEEEEEQTLYGVFENNVNALGKNIGNVFGVGTQGAIVGGTKKKRKPGKRKTEKKKKNQIPIVDKMITDEEDIEDDANVRNMYQMGHNQIYAPHYGGGPYADKYNGVKLDAAGNITDDLFQSTVLKILKKYKYDVKDSDIIVDRFKCLPDDKEVFNKMFVNVGNGSLVNSDVLVRRILGLTSFLSDKKELMPAIIKDKDGSKFHIVKTEMSDYQFGLYEKVRKEEAEQEKKSRKNALKNKDDNELYKFSSTYRIFSRALCNFAFPPDVERPMPSKKEDVSEDAVDGIKKKEIISRDNFNPEDESAITDDTSYQKKITKSLKELAKMERGGSSKYLSKDSLQMLSPKLLSLLENLQHPDNVGLHLIYSQFRTMEGVGVLKLILDANGFAEFKIKKSTNGDWSIVQKIGDEDKPKYVLYTGTETAEEKELIRNIYNSDWDVVPPSLVAQLEKRQKNNQYGELIRVLMITASGAEGISLKNTRFVHIVEPYWHMVRKNQVIGRARRIGSHLTLPKKHQNVKVYLYLSTLSESHKTSEKHIELRIRDISRIDGNTPVTTDESLFEISTLKDNINKQILDAVKSSAFDCSLYATKQSDESVACYSYGNIKSNDFGTIPNIDIDKSDKKELNLKENVLDNLQEITYKGTKYALDTKTNKIYDYESYQAAQEKMGDLIFVGNMVSKDGKQTIEFI
jgi:hypothetical protein